MKLNDKADIESAIVLKIECLENGIIVSAPREAEGLFGFDFGYQYKRTIVQSKEELLAAVAASFDLLYGA